MLIMISLNRIEVNNQILNPPNHSAKGNLIFFVTEFVNKRQPTQVVYIYLPFLVGFYVQQAQHGGGGRLQVPFLCIISGQSGHLSRTTDVPYTPHMKEFKVPGAFKPTVLSGK
jgi:hypothetical protein